jgi:hypothetical protein
MRYGSKIYCASLFVLHKGLACMPNTFVRISFGFCFKNKLVFVLCIIIQESMVFHLF